MDAGKQSSSVITITIYDNEFLYNGILYSLIIVMSIIVYTLVNVTYTVLYTLMNMIVSMWECNDIIIELAIIVQYYISCG
jgi:hypothetical protein